MKASFCRTWAAAVCLLSAVGAQADNHGLTPFSNAAANDTYVVAAIRRASNVTAGPVDSSVESVRIGQKVSFGETLRWLWGRTCLGWRIEKSPKPVVDLDDPNLSDTQVPPPGGGDVWPDRRINSHHAITCGGNRIATFSRVDGRVLIVPSPSGASYVILEKPLGPIELATLQQQLVSMKFLSGPANGTMDQRTRRGVAFYARYLGAAYDFQNGTIGENLLSGLGTTESAGSRDRPMGVDSPASLETIKIIHNGPVSAHFMGNPEPLVPPTYGVRELWFVFRGDSRKYRFNPTGTLAFSDWYFDGLYSPNGSFVLLLQDRFGPYHVIAVRHLREYLLGQREADFVVGGPAGKDEPAAVHSDAEWISNAEIQYKATCCGDSLMRKERLSGQ